MAEALEFYAKDKQKVLVDRKDSTQRLYIEYGSKADKALSDYDEVICFNTSSNELAKELKKSGYVECKVEFVCVCNGEVHEAVFNSDGKVCEPCPSKAKETGGGE